jgi:uncharacterized membrane protein
MLPLALIVASLSVPAEYVEFQDANVALGVSACSADGRFAFFASGNRFFRFNKVNASSVQIETVDLPAFSGAQTTITCCNPSGTAAAGIFVYNNTNQAIVWSTQYGMQRLEGASYGLVSAVNGISDDGRTIVGQGSYNSASGPALWPVTGPIVLLPRTLANGQTLSSNSFAHGVRINGNITTVVGHSVINTLPYGVARWTLTPNGNTTEYFSLPAATGTPSYNPRFSRNLDQTALHLVYSSSLGVLGSRIVQASLTTPEQIRWEAPAFSVFDGASTANAVSNDGTILAGVYSGLNTQYPAIWIRGTRYNLFDLLRNQGFTPTSGDDTKILAMSADCRTLWGSIKSSTSWRTTVFVATLDLPNPPRDCPSDFNNDGVVDLFDYLDFVAAFSVGC